MKNKIIIRTIVTVIVMLVGGLCFAYSFYLDGTGVEFARGFGVGMFAAGLVLFIKCIFTLKNKKSFEKLKIEENDERNINIGKSALAMTYRISIILYAIGIIVLTILAYKEIAFALAMFLLVQLIILCITYAVYNKKY